MSSIAFLTLATENGKALAHGVQTLCEKYGHECECIDKSTLNAAARQNMQTMFSILCLATNMLIVDLSREDGDSNYPIIAELPKHFNNVCIVSRNYLPVNMYDSRGTTYPTYNEQSLSNDIILRRLEDIFKNETLPTPACESYEAVDKFWQRMQSDGFAEYVEVLKKQQQERGASRKKEYRVFVSFRTQYELMGEHAVQHLTSAYNAGGYASLSPDILEHLALRQPRMRYVPQGDLAFPDEVLTRGRVWQVLASIDYPYVGDCDEFWIYATPDYWDSWWTRGEMLALYYRILNLDKAIEKRPCPVVRVYDPRTNSILATYRKPEELLPSFTADSNTFIRTYSRIISNSDPQKMGHESIKGMQYMRENKGFADSMRTYSAAELEHLRKTLLIVCKTSKFVPNFCINALLKHSGSHAPMIRSMLSWSTEQINSYIDALKEMNDAVIQIKAEHPEYSQREIMATYMGNKMGNAFSPDMSAEIHDYMKDESDEEYQAHPVFQSDFYTDKVVVVPVAADRPHGVCLREQMRELCEHGSLPVISQDVVDNFLVLTKDTPQAEGYPQQIPVTIVENTDQPEQCIAIVGNSHHACTKCPPRLIYMPPRLGGLLNFAEGGDCFETIDVWRLESSRI